MNRPQWCRYCHTRLNTVYTTRAVRCVRLIYGCWLSRAAQRRRRWSPFDRCPTSGRDGRAPKTDGITQVATRSTTSYTEYQQRKPGGKNSMEHDHRLAWPPTPDRDCPVPPAWPEALRSAKADHQLTIKPWFDWLSDFPGDEFVCDTATICSRALVVVAAAKLLRRPTLDTSAAADSDSCHSFDDTVSCTTCIIHFIYFGEWCAQIPVCVRD